MRDKETRRQGDEKHRIQQILVSLSPCLLIFAIALALRLIVWRWHEQYQLGGDEQEYLSQALALLQTHHYVELRLMRPPLYTGFLAVCIYLFDSLVQRLRLIQALISALMIVPTYLLARELFGNRRVALLAALLAGLNYTLAANATELLTETLFVFGLTTLFWLLMRAGRDEGPFGYAQGRRRTEDERSSADQDTVPVEQTARSSQSWRQFNGWAALAGLALGALILLRSVALPLLPLGALWLLLGRKTKDEGPKSTPNIFRFSSFVLRPWSITLAFVIAALIVVTPWTARNYLTYGALIVVDTTGAENLWLDNNPAASTPADPLGREAAKRELYALGDNRAARQRLATRNGLAAIAGNPGWFARKAWGEAKQFFALQYFDDMRERRAIWVPPPEVWLRLLLGDGLWLVLLIGGAAGLWLAGDRRQETGDRRWGQNSEPLRFSAFIVHPSSFRNPRWLFAPWSLYTLATAMLFHVELRYRLPLYPVLLPYTAFIVVKIADCRFQIANRQQMQSAIYNLQSAIVGAVLTCLTLLALTLLHRPYVGESWVLAQKHLALWQADRALAGSDLARAKVAANQALMRDPDSALARVALARADLGQGNQAGALASLQAAIGALKAHPYAHLLRGAILREQGDQSGAAAELAYEGNSLEDLQRWSWDAFAPFATPPAALSIGAGDLGFIQGFWLPEEDHTRWTRAEAQVRLRAPSAPNARLVLQINAGRPASAPLPQVDILVNGQPIGQIQPANGWHDYSFDVPAGLLQPNRMLMLRIRSETYRPRDYDRANSDNRELGIMVRSIQVVSQ